MLQAERGDLEELGTLPKNAPLKAWAGYGSGKLCSACDLPTTIKDIEYEGEMEDHSTFLFHQPCPTRRHQERARYLQP